MGAQVGTVDVTNDIIVQYLNVDDDPPHRDQVSGRTFNESQRRNNASLVFKLIYKDISFLITGDINGRNKEHREPASDREIDSEELELWTRHQLSTECDLKSTVLQAPHHGSNGSCSLPFLEAVDAEWIVIPAGHEHDHPDTSVVRRLRTLGIASDHVLRTDKGDSTPENDTVRDPRGNDSYIFETDGVTIGRILRVITP